MRIILLLIFLLYTSNVFAGDVIVGDNYTTEITILNEELRGLEIENQIKDAGKLDVQNKTIENVATPVNTTDGVNKAYVDGEIDAIPAQVGFGSWKTTQNDVNNTGDLTYATTKIYLAATDGLVVVSGAAYADCITDSSNPPTTTRMTNGGGTALGAVACPVLKGNYWKVTNGATIYWVSLGS